MADKDVASSYIIDCHNLSFFLFHEQFGQPLPLVLLSQHLLVQLFLFLNEIKVSVVV